MAENTKYRFAKSSNNVALMICNKTFQSNLNERAGQEKDVEKFNNCFRNLGFDTRPYFDQTAEQMVELVKKVAEEDHKEKDCLVLVISTHGDHEPDKSQTIGDVVYGVDAGIRLETLLAPLKACESLKNKPKLIFVQGCRGMKLQQASEVTETDTGKVVEADPINRKPFVELSPYEDSDNYKLPYRLPLWKDFLLAYGTPPGHACWKTLNGSPFLKHLFDVIDARAKTTDLAAMLTEVTDIVANEYKSSSSNPDMEGWKAQIWYASMLTKQVWFKDADE